MRSSSFALLLGAALTGCPAQTVDCTTEARGSVNLTVHDADGADLAGATVTFSVDDGEATACEEMGDGAYVCGWEVAGTLAIHVEAPGYLPWDGEVVVEEDECHVLPENVEAVLEANADCTDVEIPSVIATVVGASDEELTGVEVRWAPTGAEKDHACEPYGEGDWVCGWEVAGALTITAIADGHGAESVDVVVGGDECHVTTEAVTLTLDWLPD